MARTADRPPAGSTGVGLRGPHVPRILADGSPVPWFELLTDNHLAEGGVFRFQAEAVAERYPVALHGVGMSLGGTDPLDWTYIGAVRDLARRTRALHVSEHLAFTSNGGVHSHELLPLPWTQEALDHLADRIGQVQDFLGEPILVENVSAYVEFEGADYTEGRFLAELCVASGCALLLDVNNVYVNAVNHSRDPMALLDSLSWEHVREIHVAGFEARGPLLVDSHGAPVCDEVMRLLGHAVRHAPDALVLLERDTNLPDWPTLWAEARDVDAARRCALREHAA